jgi:hypothetical protein
MGFSDMAEKAASDAAYQKGGWPGWFKYKAVMVYHKCTSCCG